MPRGGPGLSALEKILPAYGWLRSYSRGDLSGDLYAALVITAMLVPQGMAYAVLAGLPPAYGLYASTVPAIVYACFGTSRHMPVGPPAIMALLTFTSVSAIAEPGTEEYVRYALLLALMVGAVQLVIGLLQMGFVTNFVSRPVLSGFVYASVIVIAVSQMEYLLGIPTSGRQSTVGTVVELARAIEQTDFLLLTTGLLSIAAMVFFAKALPRLPGALLTVAAATFLVYALGLEQRGLDVVGDVPQGLPTLSVPPLDLEAFQALAPAALVVAFVGFIESISVANVVAAREGYRVYSNQELRALGLANVAAAFFSGFPVAGSFSRTAVQYQAGGRTQAASILTAFMIVVVLLFLTPLFYYLPQAALAAVVLAAVWGLLDLKEARRVFRISASDGLALSITFALTIFLGVEEGIIAGSAFAILAYIRRTAYPKIAELGYVEEEDAFLGQDSYPEGRTFPGVLVARFDARLYFANITFLEDWLISAVADRPDLKLLIVDCRGVNGIDTTAIEGLESLISEYRSRGIEVLFTHIKPQVRKRLRRAGWADRFGEVIEHQTTRDALHDAGLLNDHEPYRPQLTQRDYGEDGPG